MSPGHVEGRRKRFQGFQWGEQKERDHLVNLGADEMMKLTWENMDLVNLNQKMENWQVIVNTVRELHFPYNSRIYYFFARLLYY